MTIQVKDLYRFLPDLFFHFPTFSRNFFVEREGVHNIFAPLHLGEG